MGVEPTTPALRKRCSAIELLRRHGQRPLNRQRRPHPKYDATIPALQGLQARFQAKLIPFIYSSHAAEPVTGYDWIAQVDLPTLPFSSGHRKIFHALNSTLVHD